ncbi:GNAT family N-acetyltransferase [Peribacillus deserti]|uniref:N-acetyltransferase n=1 Tax=Peribacillus deserti TaxID=673318 RepID=A0A2N5M981_9BACI|nr:GNAT family N-acetyltransferase [Peribacillus deserti]PLT30917.1 N-acetyltransferase [Peribacillus deserti]
MTIQYLEDLRKLQRICEEEEKIQLKLNWDTLEQRSEAELREHSVFVHGRLVGFIGFYDFGSKVEICGMVHPKYRRQGIFTKLYQNAMEEAEKRKFREILINAPSNSQTAKLFLNHIPFQYAISEYQMKWHESPLESEQEVTIRQRTEEDTELEIELDVKCFGLLRHEAVKFHTENRKERNQQSYIIEHEGKAVGKMRVSCMDQKESWIYGFAVLPEYQGKGIGRQALKAVIRQEQESGHEIFLEVEAKNQHALRLYTSSGFQPYYTQDYYKYSGVHS